VKVHIVKLLNHSPPAWISDYRFQSEVERLPLPVPELLVAFSLGGHLGARTISAPALKVDIITNFDFIEVLTPE
jgi:hypothetical protein